VAKKLAQKASKEFAKRMVKSAAKKMSKDMSKKLAARFVQYTWPQMLVMGVAVNVQVGEKAAVAHIEKVMPNHWSDFIPIYGEGVFFYQLWNLATKSKDLEKAVEGAITDDLATQISNLPEESPFPPACVVCGCGLCLCRKPIASKASGNAHGPTCYRPDPLDLFMPTFPTEGGDEENHSNATNHTNATGEAGSGHNQPTIPSYWAELCSDHNTMQAFVGRLKEQWESDGTKGNWVVILSIERNHPSQNQPGVPANSRRVKIVVVAGPLARPKINPRWFLEPAYQSTALKDVKWYGDGHKGDRPKVGPILDAVNYEVENILRGNSAMNNGPPPRLRTLGGGFPLTFQRTGRFYNIGGKKSHFFEMP